MLNREISEDLTEDVFVKVLTNLDSYNPSSGGVIDVDIRYRKKYDCGLSKKSIRQSRK